MIATLATLADTFPPEFDPQFYRSSYPDLECMDPDELAAHYAAFGIIEGRRGSPASDRRGFVSLVPASAKVLEIGPFASPIARGPNVRYFDILDRAGLVSRAESLGLSAEACPQIDYVSPDGTLSVIEDTFDVALSCHSIEHQVDLVGHLNEVAKILNGSGYYFLIVPDKRYCFDYFLAETTLADLLGAHHQQRNKVHSLKSVIEHRALTTHNDIAAHWRGEHGLPRFQSAGLTVVHAAIREYKAAQGAYIDVHSWQFTRRSFRQLIEQLFELNYSALRPIRVYHPVRNTPEFCAILQKVST